MVGGFTTLPDRPRTLSVNEQLVELSECLTLAAVKTSEVSEEVTDELDGSVDAVRSWRAFQQVPSAAHLLTWLLKYHILLSPLPS